MDRNTQVEMVVVPVLKAAVVAVVVITAAVVEITEGTAGPQMVEAAVDQVISMQLAVH
jgi:hypothetical protein